jgi:hypothetical protein
MNGAHNDMQKISMVEIVRAVLGLPVGVSMKSCLNF